MAVATPSPSISDTPWASEKAKGPSVMWCITRPSCGSFRIQISKKQLKISYVVGSLLQPQQSEKDRSLCAQQLLLAPSINRCPASLQTSLVLREVESFSRRTSAQPASAAWWRWWKAGKDEFLGDPGFTTAGQVMQGRMCTCVPHSPTMVSHHWGITGNISQKQLEGSERDPNLVLPLHGVGVEETTWVTPSTEKAAGTWGYGQVVPS